MEGVGLGASARPSGSESLVGVAAGALEGAEASRGCRGGGRGLAVQARGAENQPARLREGGFWSYLKITNVIG